MRGLDKDLAKVLQLNQSILLSLYASMDMGIHYQGWDASDVKNFLSDYGISNASAANDTYEYILGEPANYLKILYRVSEVFRFTEICKKSP